MDDILTILLVIIILVVVFGVLFFLLGLIGGITNTSYKIGGGGPTIEPIVITKEDINDIAAAASKLKDKISDNISAMKMSRYERTLLDLQKTFQKERTISIKDAEKYIRYCRTLYQNLSLPEFDNEIFLKNLLEVGIEAEKSPENIKFYDKYFSAPNDYQPKIKLRIEFENQLEGADFTELARKIQSVMEGTETEISEMLKVIDISNVKQLKVSLETIANFYWTNKLTKTECQKLIGYLRSTY